MANIIVIGAGWAGLSCAYELVKHGHKVKILEAAPQVGGRARSTTFAGHIVDNGQHLALGAYHHVRSLINDLGLIEKQLFKILPLQIITISDAKFQLRLPNLPSPLNLCCGLLFAKNLTWQDKLSITKFIYKLQQNKHSLSIDITALDFLRQQQQSANTIANLWAPLTLAALSTSIEVASAKVLINVLKQTLTPDKNNSHWYLPAIDLSNLLPIHIVKYLQQLGNEVHCNQTVKTLNIQGELCSSISTHEKEWVADHYVLATNPWQASRLLAFHPLLVNEHQLINNLSFEPITTIYFLFPHAVKLPYPIIGMLNSACQWIFDRAFATQPNILSVVTTGHHDVFNLAKQDVYNCILQEIKTHFPWLNQPIKQMMIREKRAAFNCDVNTQKLRPFANTACKNLWLCGDYLQNGLPATLEGAVQSGKQTAKLILSITN